MFDILMPYYLDVVCILDLFDKHMVIFTLCAYYIISCTNHII